MYNINLPNVDFSKLLPTGMNTLPKYADVSRMRISFITTAILVVPSDSTTIIVDLFIGVSVHAEYVRLACRFPACTSRGVAPYTRKQLFRGA